MIEDPKQELVTVALSRFLHECCVAHNAIHWQYEELKEAHAKVLPALAKLKARVAELERRPEHNESQP